MPLKYKNNAIILLLGVMLLLFVGGWLISASSFRHNMESVKSDVKEEIALITFLVKERLQKRDYQQANSFILGWGKNSSSISSIKLTSQNGYELAAYDSGVVPVHFIVESKEISFSYDSKASLVLKRNIDDLYRHEENFRYQLISGYFFIFFILYYLVKNNIRIHSQKLELQEENAQRKKVEIILQEREQNLAITLNSIGDAVITTNPQGYVTSMNPVAELITGFMFEQLNNQVLDDIYYCDDKNDSICFSEVVQDVLNKKKTIYLRDNITLRDQEDKKYNVTVSVSPINSLDGQILGVVLVMSDVTEQHYLREAIAISEAKVRLLLNSTAEAIYGSDINGDCRFVNRACIDMLGYKSEADLIGKNIHKLVHSGADDFDYKNSPVAKVIKTGEGIHIKDESFWRKDSSSFSAEYWVYPIMNNNSCEGAVVTFFDITSKKMTDEILRRSQKMDALGKLTGGIAHDYNNMLSIVSGYAELLFTQVDKDSKFSQYACEILHAAERGTKLTKKLLGFSKYTPSNKQLLDINLTLTSQKDMLEKTLTSRIKLQFNLDKDLWPVWVDVSDFEDAIINICINGVYAIERTGQITIETKNKYVDSNNIRELGLSEEGDYVLVNIVDTGRGMDNETIEKIFDPFYSTKGDMGTGLGLSQVYGFVQRSDGYIMVYSKIGEGTCFSIYFPREKTLHENAIEEKEGKISINGTEKILVVDD